ncbi:MAG: hypothetical protein HYV32_04890 [Candidatus Kerfeldbacteria bacterium]|nr:hypothetical protein [Candidatus Kerfeldbacteria bacterium]
MKKTRKILTPKVYFIDMPLDMEIEMLNGFLFESFGGWNKYVLRRHPELKKAYTLKTDAERRAYIRNYIIQFRKTHKAEMVKKKEQFQKAWKTVEKEYFTTLQELMDIEWPKQRNKIYAMISINPICPRFLDEWNFSLFYNYDDIHRMIEVIMHESCHFLYFEKWKELYPKADRKTFDAPYIEWYLSEISAPIILNEPRIQPLLKKRARFYKEHQRIKIGTHTAPAYFKKIYTHCIKQEDGFALFLREAYKEIKKHKKLFLESMK